MSIRYERDRPLEPQTVADLYDEAGLRRPTGDNERIGRMLANSNLVVSAWDTETERLVGVARALTDFAYACYLSDLAVHPEYQNQGIGRELIRRTQDYLGDEVMVLLLAAPAAAAYYAHLGFAKVENGWFLARTR